MRSSFINNNYYLLVYLGHDGHVIFYEGYLHLCNWSADKIYYARLFLVSFFLRSSKPKFTWLHCNCSYWICDFLEVIFCPASKKTKLILPRSTCNNNQLEKTYYKIYPILERTELPCYAVVLHLIIMQLNI